MGELVLPALEHPYPGDDLVHRASGSTNRTWFVESGRQSVRDLEAVLAIVGRRLEDHPRILEFGCGCGRILLWLSSLLTKSDIHGTDIDQTAIEWASAHIPRVTFHVNRPTPPLDCTDEFFDLVYCHSVFTHIDETYQNLWLNELRRVTRHGGLVVLSVSGEHAFRDMEERWHQVGGDPSPYRRIRESRGLVHITDDEFVGGPFPDFYHTTFHSPGYVFAHWGTFFKIRAYVPRGSLNFTDYVLLERASDVSTAEPPLPGPLPSRVPDAVSRAAAQLVAPGWMDHPTRFGFVTRLGRRLVSRALRFHEGQQRHVNQATIDALREIAVEQRFLREAFAKLDRMSTYWNARTRR